METSKIKKIVFGGLLLMSVLQITQHFIKAPDYIYGGLFGITLGILEQTHTIIIVLILIIPYRLVKYRGLNL